VEAVKDLDDEVRRCVFEVLDGAVSAEEFQAWFVERTWDDRSPLVAQVDHLLAERSLLHEADFLEELRRLASTIQHSEVPVVTATSATATTIRPQSMHFGGTATIRDRLELAGT
jgi:hypothetical protein